jgi:hypothetical protein
MKYIRKITSNLLLLTLIIAFSCSKELPKPSLIGTWKEGRTIIGCPDGSFDKSTCSSNCNAVISATTFTDTDVAKTVYNYTVNGNIITLKSGTFTLTYTYELTVGSLTIAITDQSGCVYTYYYTKV